MSTIDWVFERTCLATYLRDHPDWSAQRLAEACGHSLSWVKRWRRIIQRHTLDTGPLSHVLKGRSSAPHTRPNTLLPLVRNTILSFRDQLPALYNRRAGPKTILYHLHADEALKQQVSTLGGYLPKSSRTVWSVLKEGGRLPKPVKEHCPLVRAAPMSLWELDFGQLGQAPEFLVVADQGTSMMVDGQSETHYTAESALMATAKTLLVRGLPDKLRFDRDPRLVSSWGMDGYPSPFMRFLLGLGVVPDPCPPRRPDLKPIVERMIRTVKHECLWAKRPKNADQTDKILTDFRHFYNNKRPNQSVVCQNHPPVVVFPSLPDRPDVPDMVDPDAWVAHYNRFCFRRRANAQGVVSIDRQRYTLGAAYAGQRVTLKVNAPDRCFEVIAKGSVALKLPIKGLCDMQLGFPAYLTMMAKEARSMDRLRAIKKKIIKRVKLTT